MGCKKKCWSTKRWKLSYRDWPRAARCWWRRQEATKRLSVAPSSRTRSSRAKSRSCRINLSKYQTVTWSFYQNYRQRNTWMVNNGNSSIYYCPCFPASYTKQLSRLKEEHEMKVESDASIITSLQDALHNMEKVCAACCWKYADISSLWIHSMIWRRAQRSCQRLRC